MTYKIYTLGCKVNQYDSNSLSWKLIGAGFMPVEQDADLAIVNTCTVTKTAIHKDKRMFNKARKENPRAKIVLMGCWVNAQMSTRLHPRLRCSDVNSGQWPQISGLKADLVWGTGKPDELVKEILKFKSLFLEYNTIVNYQTVKEDRSRYFIKVQDGCEQFCSYCVIAYARGKLWSRPMAEIIDEIAGAVKKGYREIVLCGIHLGLYGINNRRDEAMPRLLCPFPSLKKNKVLSLNKDEAMPRLYELIMNVIKIKDLGRIRLSSIEVTEVTDEIIKLMAGNRKMCRHLHIPLQSGSDKILKLMNRPYTTAYFSKKVAKIRKAVPEVAITIDVIIGFPGETEKEFKETYEFIKEMKFSRLHVFPFSAHEKTPAFQLPGQVKKEVIKERVEKLKRLGEKLEKEYEKQFLGQELALVIENMRGKAVKGINKRFIGKSEYYIDYYFEKPQIISSSEKIKEKIMVGKIIKVKIQRKP